MTTKYERDIYLFLSLYRFFAYGLAAILIQEILLEDARSDPPLWEFVPPCPFGRLHTAEGHRAAYMVAPGSHLLT